MKKILLSLSIIFVLGMTACSSKDKAEGAENSETLEAGYFEDEDGKVIGAEMETKGSENEQAALEKAQKDLDDLKKKEQQAIDQLNSQVDAELDAVEREINNAMINAELEEDE